LTRPAGPRSVKSSQRMPLHFQPCRGRRASDPPRHPRARPRATRHRKTQQRDRCAARAPISPVHRTRRVARRRQGRSRQQHPGHDRVDGWSFAECRVAVESAQGNCDRTPGAGTERTRVTRCGRADAPTLTPIFRTPETALPLSARSGKANSTAYNQSANRRVQRERPAACESSPAADAVTGKQDRNDNVCRGG
jgi:hypothetical protein